MPEYRSAVANWDSKSTVRSKPRRMLSEENEGRSFFSAELTPSAAHPLVVCRGGPDVQELLTRRLYSYLDFTTILEQEIVNPVVLRLSRDAYGLTLSDDMRFDAYRIYCDEAYHALFSVDIKRQVEACTGINASGTIRQPYFAHTIRRVKASLPSNLGTLAELCAAIVSETLISGSLTKIPSDPTVAKVVRETISDHAMDERTHHAYFSKVLDVVWPQIDSTTQQLLSPYFADLILGFLVPDEQVQRCTLRQMRFTRDEARQILLESHPVDETIADVRHAARSTIRLLQRNGVLANNLAIDHFTRLGLILPG
jgi:para-aminobenzoate N-oxygenase AurF